MYRFAVARVSVIYFATTYVAADGRRATCVRITRRFARGAVRPKADRSPLPPPSPRDYKSRRRRCYWRWLPLAVSGYMTSLSYSIFARLLISESPVSEHTVQPVRVRRYRRKPRSRGGNNLCMIGLNNTVIWPSAFVTIIVRVRVAFAFWTDITVTSSFFVPTIDRNSQNYFTRRAALCSHPFRTKSI